MSESRTPIPLPVSGGARSSSRLWRATLGCLRSVRPTDTALVVLGALIGARLARPLGFGAVGTAAVALANGALCAASMAFNDWHDVEEDTINRPQSPIVSGSVGRNTVLGLACALFAVGVVLSWIAPGWRFGAMAFVVVAASVGYTMRLKSVPFIGNATVAVVHTYPIWCWALWETSPTFLYLPICLAVISDRFGSEMVKAAEDWEGDQRSQLRTVATAWGPGRALLLGCAGFVAAVLIAWSPLAIGEPSLPYVLWVVMLTTGMAVVCIQPALGLPPQNAARRAVQVHRVVLTLAVAGLLLA
jgi:4-hydroxybenzoate polyprenyltransferase